MPYMIINKITNALYPYKSLPVNNINKNFLLSFKGTEGDSFELSDSKENNIAKKVFSSTKKFSVRDYNKLNQKQLDAMRKICLKNEGAKEAADDSIEMALLLKSYLDDLNGEGNYVFVSIGRSPVGIARAFEFMGVETKYLPISRLTYYPDYECVLGGANGLKEYRKFLNKQGIYNENIGLSGKQYYFFDYTNSGNSLYYFEKLLRKGYKINTRNMHFLSLNRQLVTAGEKMDERQYCEKTLKSISPSRYIIKYLKNSGIQDYGGISELRVDRLYDITKCKDFESDEAKIFNFLVMDRLQEMGLLKENRKNRKSL